VIGSFKKFGNLGYWIWERNEKIMKGLRKALITVTSIITFIFAINLIIQNIRIGFALILPVALSLTVPVICFGLMLFAWILTERTRKDEKRFKTNCLSWAGAFTFLALTMVFKHKFSFSSFPLVSGGSPISWEHSMMTFLFAGVGFVFLLLVHKFLDRAVLGFFIFLLVAGSSIVLYFYYCISVNNWSVILGSLGCLLGGIIYAMIHPEVMLRIEAK